MRGDGANLQDVVDLLRRALTLLDTMGHSVAAAQVDHVLHTIQARSETIVGL